MLYRSTEALYDWERMTQALAAESPWWEPGSASGYHALTFGHLVGEVIRRVTGRSPGAFFRDEIAQPLRIGIGAAIIIFFVTWGLAEWLMR